MGRRLIACLLLLAVAGALPLPAWAAYPDRPIHLIVPFSPGGGAVGLVPRIQAGQILTPAAFGALIDDQIAKWSVVVEKARIHVD